jgi:hypothetical protein
MPQADDVNVYESDVRDPDDLELLADLLAGIVKRAVLEALHKVVDAGADAEVLAALVTEYAEQAATGWEMSTH